jgi:hypothetical protein
MSKKAKTGKKVETKDSFKRLTDKELRELEKAVYNDNYIFEESMHDVLNRHAWASLLTKVIKNKAKMLTKETKAKLAYVAKSCIDICEEDAINLVLEHFAGDVSKNRTKLAVERALRKKDNKEPMRPEERLLAEFFSAK